MRDAREAAALAHLQALAQAPRTAGSANESAVRQYCRRRLEGNGFSVREEPFTFSAAVGRWGGPVAGAVLSAVMIAVALGRPIAWLAAAAVALGGAGRWAATRGVLVLPVDRREGVNLVASRGNPEMWLVAHLDSKSQPMPILARAAAVTALLVVVPVLLTLGALQVVGVALPSWTPWLAILGALAAITLALAWTGESSPGAADNATGVATLLSAVDGLSADVTLGVVITSAEEMALAGARAWVSSRTAGRTGGTLAGHEGGNGAGVGTGGPPHRENARRKGTAPHLIVSGPALASPPLAINVDTIDDFGTFRCLAHGARSHLLAVRLARAGQAISRPILVQSLIPGISSDGVALADAGWRVVTLTRGTLATLWRIHTPRDSVDRLTGRGVAAAAHLLREFVERASR